MRKYMPMNDYSYHRTMKISADRCFARISSMVKEIGFILLSYVDMQEIMRKNFSDEFHPYYILEVCKPAAAREMIGMNEEYGLFLPCKIVIDERNGSTELMLARVSRQSADYLSADPSVARKYEDELTAMLEKI